MNRVAFLVAYNGLSGKGMQILSMLTLIWFATDTTSSDQNRLNGSVFPDSIMARVLPLK